jgi:GntR family transcriptional regulator
MTTGRSTFVYLHGKSVIDHDADRALHKQLADLLRDEIDSGALPPGELLPSELYLRQTHGLSQTVVRRALELLQNEGLVTKRRGRRTCVRERSPRQVVLLSRGDDVDTRMPTEAERRLLGMPVGEPVFLVRRPGGKIELFAGGSTTLRAP